MAKQLNFNLDKEEEIHFKLPIKESVEFPDVKPVIRFVIMEKTANKSTAIILPASLTEDGVNITVPQLKNIFSENKKYIGKLEIITGNQYSSPITVDVRFTKSLDEQIEPIKSSIDDIPDEVLAALEIELPEIKKEPIFKPIIVEENKPFIQRNQQLPTKIKTKKEPAYKAEFMNLLREAFNGK